MARGTTAQKAPKRAWNFGQAKALRAREKRESRTGKRLFMPVHYDHRIHHREEQDKIMMHQEQIILIVCADPRLMWRYCSEFEQSGAAYRLLLVISAAEAHRAFLRVSPAVILLDASVPDGGSGPALESTVSLLIEAAPVVVVAAPKQQCALAFLIDSGAVDFVARVQCRTAGRNFVSVAASLTERRIRLAPQLATHSRTIAGLRRDSPTGWPTGWPTEEFGEKLRHEVDHPLTGILGNAELLLARRELPATAMAKIETIAALAVRLRETVRRLSLACGSTGVAENGTAGNGATVAERPARPAQPARLPPRQFAVGRS